MVIRLFDVSLKAKKKAPPEPLVLSAKLRCPNSLHKECSYLWVDADVIDINNLPQANVDDYIPQKNILSFGLCKARDGKACDMYMEFDKPWTNPEPQGLLVNGKEAITTDSILQCKNADAPIEILSSGQDPIAASQFIFRMEMDKKYPGLRAILDDPNGSLYLNKGKYKIALQFLEDRMEENGGAISLYRLADKDPEIYYVRLVLARLVPGLKVESLQTFVDSFHVVTDGYNEATQKTIDDHSLNEAMLVLLKKFADDNNKKIQAGGLYKGQEENKEFLANLAEIVKAAVYIALAKGSSGGKGGSGADEAIIQGNPRANHKVSDGKSLPGKGEPNSSADLLNPDGTVKQRRYYGDDGRPQVDIDFNHTDDGTHTFPHRHIWDWDKNPPRQDSR